MEQHSAPDTALYEHVLEASPDGIMVIETGGRIAYANRSMLAIAGIDGPLVGHNVDTLVPSDVRRRHRTLRQAYERRPTQRPMGSGLELSLERTDGALVPVEISLSPFEDANGVHVIAAVRDVTERREQSARLAAANQQLALVDERARIGRDLHDVVLQRLYGTGMTVQAIAADSGAATGRRLETVVAEVDRIITEVRTIVFTLGTTAQAGTFGSELGDVVAQSSRVLGFTPGVQLRGPVESVLSAEAKSEMLASMREALGNVARHADASSVDVAVVVEGPQVTMTVTDDGRGLPRRRAPRTGNGLINLRARAAALGGTCELASGRDGGAVLTWRVPH